MNCTYESYELYTLKPYKMAQIQNNYLNCDYLNVSQIIFKKSYLRLNIA